MLAKVILPVGGAAHGPDWRAYLAVSAFFAWILVAAAVYRAANDWTWTNALYFSVQAGLNVGFGSLEETSDVSRLFSAVHVLMGGALVACLLGFAVEPLLFRLASPPSAAAQRRVVALALAGVAAWVGAGAAYFSLARGLAWPVALEFCASAVTTTGMVGLPAPGNRLGDGAALSLAAYSLVGVCAYMLLIREGARLASMHSGARITVAICAPGSA